MAKGEARASRARRERSAAIQFERGRVRRGRGDLLAGTALAFLVGCGLFTFAGPVSAQVSGVTGGTVVGGSATIANTAPGHVTVTQSTNRGVIDWRSFSIGAGERVDFLQPGTSSVTLNRVTGPDPSVIAGRLTATGQLILVNGAGIVFANGAQINAAGLVASTANVVDPQRFMQGGTVAFDRPSGDPNAGVVNAGTITVQDGGLVGLVGNTASNSGTINARLGRVTVGGAETFTVDLAGDGLINFQLGNPVSRQPVDPQGNKRPLASNTGTINADGGVVTLTARAARGVVDNVVNAGGTINARAVRNEGGVVVFGGDEGATVNITGTVDVSGGQSQRGGQVVASAAKGTVNVAATAKINASGGSGGGTVLIGGNKQGQGPVANARNTNVAKGATITADATEKGNGGTVIVWADNATVFGGTISAKGGPQGGDGGFAEVSGKVVLDFNGLVDLRASGGATGTLLLDPSDITITNGTDDIDQSNGNPKVITGKSDASILSVTTLVNALKTANVVVDAAGGGGKGTGSITVASDVSSLSGNNLTLNALTDITLSANINLGTGTLAFVSTTGALVGSGGAVTAAAVTLAMGGGVTLDNAANSFGNISGTSGGAITVLNSASLVIGNLSAGTGSTLSVTTAGATSNLTVNGTVSGTGVILTAGGKLTGSGAISGNTGKIAVTAGGIDGINLSGIISGAGVIVKSASGGVTLNNALNAFGSFAATGVVGGNVTVVHTGALTIDATDAGSNAASFTTITGDITVAGALTAKGGASLTAAGELAVNAAIDATGAVVSLSGMSITQTAAGAITANSLTAAATGIAGTISLDAADNAVARFAAGAVGDIAFRELDGFDIDTVGSLIGIATFGNVQLQAGGSITQTQAVIAAGLAATTTTGDVNLTGATNAVGIFAAQAKAGNIGFKAAGALVIGTVGGLNGIEAKGNVQLSATKVTQTQAISAAGLGVTATAGEIDLTGATNKLATFAASSTGSTQLLEADGFAVGSVLAIGALSALNGVTATGVVALAATGEVAINAAINAAGGVVGLTGTSITQSNVGTITAGSLVVVALTGSIDLTQATSAVTTFAATAPEGDIGFNASGGLVIGSIAGVNGISAKGAVRLAAGGTVTQTEAVSAAGLGITTATGDINLTNATNKLATFAAISSGAVTLQEADGVAVGLVGTVGALATLTGVTATASVSLTTIGALAVNAAIMATGADVALNATTITQSSAGAITAGGLAAVATAGDIGLTQATSAVTTFAAKAEAGNAGFKASNGFVIGSVGGIEGILTVATGTTTLVTSGGTISQTKAITTGTLDIGTASSSATVTLTNSGNKIDTVLSTNGLGTGAVTIVDGSGGLSVGPIAGSGAITIKTSGGALVVAGDVSTAAGNGSVSLTSTDDAITVNAKLSAGAGTMTLTSGGSITATAGAITAAILTLETGASGAAVITTAAHNVGTVQTTATGVGSGGITFEQGRAAGTQVGTIVTKGGGDVSISESVGAVTVTGPINTGAGGGNVTLTASNSTLGVSSQINAGTGVVALLAKSAIIQGAGADITASGLRAENTSGNISLTAPNNAVGTFAAASGGSVFYTSKSTFIVGTVDSTAGITAGSSVTLTVITDGGTITQSKDADGRISTGTLNITTNNGSVTVDNETNVISALGIIDVGTGAFTFSNNAGGNLNVGGNVNALGGIRISNSGKLTTTADIVSDGDIALTSTNGQILLNGAVTSNLGSIELHSKNTLNTGASAISAKAGSVTLISDAGTVTIGSGGVIVGNKLTIQIAEAQTLSVTGAIVAPQIALIADDMVISAAVGDATTTSITLAPVSVGRAITLGGSGDVANTLTLTDAALSFLAPGASLTIGSSTAGAISVRGGTIVNNQLHLLTGSGITQSGILSIGGDTGTLIVTAADSVSLETGVLVGTIDGSTTSGDFSIVRNGGAPAALTVRSIVAERHIVVRNLDGDLVVVGTQTSTTGNIVLEAGGAVGAGLTLNASLNAASGSVFLRARDGILQQPGRVITAQNLLAGNLVSGDISLDGNNVVGGNIGFSNPVGGLSFTNDATFVIGGIATVNAAGTNFSLAGGAGVRVATNTVLRIGGNVTQTTGAIATGTLIIAGSAGGSNVTLDNANNAVGSVGAISLATGAFTLANLGNLAIDGPVVAGGGISLKATNGGTITLNAALDAGSADVRFDAGGSVLQAGGATITAGSVDARALGIVALNAANTFGVITGSGAAGFSAVTTQALTIGADGVQSPSGSVTLRSLNSGITVANAISAATTVSLFANGGDIVDTVNGGIKAAGLQAVAAGSVDLSNAAASNKVSTIAGSASGSFLYSDDQTASLAVGTVGTVGVTSTAGSIAIKTASGALGVNNAVTAANGSVTLQSNGNLGLAAKVAANTGGGRVSLTSTTGSVVENVGGAIVAAELLALAAVNVDIAQSTNVVGAKGFAAQATSGFVVFRNSGAVELDQVAGVNGVTAGGAVFISTTSGNISQTATGVIKAGKGLGLEAQNGSVILDQANEVIGNVAVANTKNGSVTIRTVGDLNIGAVDAINTAGVDVPLLNGITASTAAGKFVSLISDSGAITQSLGANDSIIGGELRIATNNRDATLANTGNQLVAVGSVNLGDGRLILVDSAGGLDVNGAVQANGGVSLTTQGGAMSVLGSVTAGNGDISLTNKDGALITQGNIIAGDGDISLTAQGALTVQAIIATAKGDISLTAKAGALAVQASVATTSGNVSLTSVTSGISLSADVAASNQLQLMGNGGTIVQTAGMIVAQSLVASAAGSIELTQAGNDVATIAGESTTGTFRYRDATAITVAGLTTANQDITVVAGQGGVSGGISINAAVSAGTGTVRLETGQGDITQASASPITAGALLANATAGSVLLDGSVNAVASVAGTAQGSFSLSNAGSLTVSSVAGDSLAAAATGIVTSGAVNLQTTGGSIGQTAAIMGDSLNAVAGGAGSTVVLNASANAFGKITGSAAAGFSVTSSLSLTVDKAGVSSSAGAVSLTAAGAASDLRVDGIVTAAGVVTLTASGSIVDSGAGGIVAQSLQATATTGSVDLSSGAANHAVGVLAGSANGSFTYVSNQTKALTVGTVSSAGVTSANGSVTIATAGELNINQAVRATAAGEGISLVSAGNLSLAAGVTASAVSGSVSLISTAGSIVSTTAAGLVTGNRGVLRAGISVDLARAGNAIGAGGLAGSASNGFFVLSSSTGIHVDTVGGVGGITSKGATILTAGTGSITQDASGTIAAGGGLGARADAGSVVLDQVNAVNGNFFGSAAGGSVTFHNSGAVNIGAVSVASLSGGLLQGNGVTASVASGAFVSLQSDNGTVGQDAAAGARIVGGELRIVTTNQDATLVNTSNAIEAVGNTNLGTGKLTVFDSTGGLTLSAPVIADGGVILTTQGAFTLPGSIVVANGDISLTSLTAGINLGSTLSAVNGQVQLVAGGSGAITQTGGTITARSLIARAPGDIDLVQSGNDIGVIAGVSGAGTFRYRDATAATIGTLVDSTGTVVSGVTTANRDITIVGGDGGVTGGIGINAAINAGTGTVRLQTGQGNITQTATSPITAQTLLAIALHGSVELGGSINNVTNIAGAALGGTFTLQNAGGVTVTGIASDTITIGASGIVTNNGDILLQGRGAIVLGGTLNAANGNATAGPGAGNITLLAEGGSVSQVGSAAIVGTDLRVEATGNVDLANAGNDVVRIAGLSRTGTFRYRDANALTVDAIGGIAGITANDRDIGIHAGGDLTLNQAVDARGAAGTTTTVVRLQATNGNITQSAAGNVIAGTLLANTVGSGDIVLTNYTNLVRSGVGTETGNPGFVAGTASGNFRFVNGNDLTVNNVAVIGDSGLGINGAVGVTAGTGRLVDLGVSAGDLSIQGPVGANAGMILYRRVAGAPIGDIIVGGASGNPGNGVGGAYLVVVDLTGSSSQGLTGLSESGPGSFGPPTGLFTTPTPPTTQFPSGLGGPNTGGELTIGGLLGIDATVYLAGGATSLLTSSAPGFFGVLGVYAPEGARVNLQSIVRAIPNTTIRPIGPFSPNDPGPVGSPPDVVARDFVRKGGLPSINQRFNNCVIAGPSCTTIFTQIANPPTTADDAVIGVAGSSLDDSSIILVNQGNEDFIEDDDERRRAEKR